MTTGIGALGDLLPQQGRGGRIFGVVVGVVTDVADPQGENRVQVRFPWLPNDPLGAPIAGPWARVVAPMAGASRGLWLLPQKGDEVAVMFEHGDPNHPYVIGALWNGQDKPPVTGSPPPQKAVLSSVSGHTITLDDTKGAEKITIADKTGKNTLSFDSSSGNVAFKAANELSIVVGSSSVVVGTDKVTVSCSNFELKAGNGYSLTVGPTVIQGQAKTLDVKSIKVTINDGALEVT